MTQGFTSEQIKHALLGTLHSDTVPAAPVAGDMIYANSTPNWARLPKGTNGQIIRQTSGFPAWVFGWPLKASTTISGAAVTAVDFTGLDINTDKFYYLALSLKNATITEALINLYVEADYTDGHYYSQVITANDTTLAGARYNIPHLSTLAASGNTFVTVFICRDPDGYLRYNTVTATYAGSSVRFSLYSGNKSDATIANITQIRVAADVASSLAIGSVLRLYALG